MGRLIFAQHAKRGNYFQFWSAYVPCGAQHLDAVQLALEQIDVIKRLADLYPSYLQLVTTAKGQRHASSDKRPRSSVTFLIIQLIIFGPKIRTFAMR
jgi:hypothetical protein